MNQKRDLPQPDDAVLGGQNLPHHAAVLGGIEGVKKRLQTDNFNQKVASLSEAMKYDRMGIELVIFELKESSSDIKWIAYSLLKNNPDKTVKDKVLECNPYRFFKRKFTLSHHNDAVSCIVVSPDGNGKMLVSGSWDKTIALWNVEAIARQERPVLQRSLRGHRDWVYSLAMSPDGQAIASGGADKTIKIWNVKTGKQMASLESHTFEILSLAFSPDGKILVSGSGDDTIKFWDVESGELIKTAIAHINGVYSLAFSLDGKTLFSGGGDNTIKIWNFDRKDGKVDRFPTIQTSVEAHDKKVLSLATNGEVLASGGGDRTIKLWNLQGKRRDKSASLQGTLNAHRDCVSSIAISSDGKTLVSGSEDSQIKIWDIETGTLLQTLNGHDETEVYSVAFSPDSKTIVSAGADGTVELWQL